LNKETDSKLLLKKVYQQFSLSFLNKIFFFSFLLHKIFPHKISMKFYGTSKILTNFTWFFSLRKRKEKICTGQDSKLS